MQESAKSIESPRQRLLGSAVELFAHQGYTGSSVRDLARNSEISLAGLYHHFASKEEILFEIQKEAFEQLLAPLAHFDRTIPPGVRLELFVKNHIGFFSRQTTKMKLLSHELSALEGERGNHIGRLRAKYYQICLEAVTDLLEDMGGSEVSPRVATMSLFGMINWIYRWYPRPSDPGPDELARQMLMLFLHGIKGRVRPLPAS
jgi:AcrR family transcriptional regulator